MKVTMDFSYFDHLIGKGVKNAVFDVDNAITKSNIVQILFFVKRRQIKTKV